MTDFSLLITHWYRQNKRDLPWRHTKDPYFIWLSEIILQQTRVEQGKSYYLKFIAAYPTLKDLAEATEQDVLNNWQGLGYYSRARNLHATAKHIMTELNGKFPDSYKDLLKLKGIGTYTAAAIASFAYNEPVAVVDGNVYRVLSRIFDIPTPIDSNEGKKEFFNLAQKLILKKEPDTYNQAIMEFGAMQCVPNKPNCESCPVQVSCLAFAENTVKIRPVKSKKTAVRDRYFHYLIFYDEDATYLHQRTSKDIWQQLYQFPMIETKNLESVILPNLYTDKKPDFVSKEIIHKLSHQTIHAIFYHFEQPPARTEVNWVKTGIDTLQDFPLPRLIDRYLEDLS